MFTIDKPEVASNTKSPYIVVEGQTATLECTLTDANPNTGITWRWSNTDSPDNMLHNGPIYTLSNIQRNGSGVLRCIASNFVGTSEPVNIYIDVQCKSNNQSYVKANESSVYKWNTYSFKALK